MPHFVPVDSIFIGERQRKEDVQKHIDALATDIKLNGLLHAPVVDLSRKLVVGWCRLMAIKLLDSSFTYGNETVPQGYIPVNMIAEPDERKIFRIELAENLKRKNLSPMDEAIAVAKLHAMFKEDNPMQTHMETGQELQKLRQEEPRSVQADVQEVTDSLLINSFANDPDVVKAATRREAVRIAKKKLEEQFTVGLGSLVRPKSNDFTLMQGSLLDILPILPDESFSGIITDPPYGMGADEFGEQSSATGHQYDDSIEHAMSLIAAIVEHGYRLCKPDAHMYLFCDIRVWPDLVQLCKNKGWQPFATPLIWYKPGLGHAPQPGFFGRRYECLLFAQKGNRKLSKSAADVFVQPAVKEKMYAAQKPVELLSELCGLSFYPGEHILDPCCGSGSIFRAGMVAKLRVTGIEISELGIGLSKVAMGEAK